MGNCLETFIHIKLEQHIPYVYEKALTATSYTQESSHANHWFSTWKKPGQGDILMIVDTYFNCQAEISQKTMQRQDFDIAEWWQKEINWIYIQDQQIGDWFRTDQESETIATYLELLFTEDDR